MPISKITNNSIEDNAVDTEKVLKSLTNLDLSDSAAIKETQLELPLQQKINDSFAQVFGNGSTIPGLINQIQDIAGGDLPDASVDGNSLVNSSISGDKLIDGSVTTNKLTNNNVTRSKIASDFFEIGTWECALYGSSASNYNGPGGTPGNPTVIDTKTATYVKIGNFVFAHLPSIGSPIENTSLNTFTANLNVRLDAITLPFKPVHLSIVGSCHPYNMGANYGGVNATNTADIVLLGIDRSSTEQILGSNAFYSTNVARIFHMSHSGGYSFPYRISNISSMQMNLMYMINEN